MPKSKDSSGGFRLDSIGVEDDVSLNSGAKQLIIIEARKALKGNAESVVFLGRTYGITGEVALKKWAEEKLPDERLMQERVEVMREKLITDLALVVVYENDERAKETLKDFGLEGEENILKRARKHPEFREVIMWAKRYKRERDQSGVESEETSKALKRLKVNDDGRVIDSFADYRIADHKTLSTYISRETLDFLSRK